MSKSKLREVIQNVRDQIKAKRIQRNMGQQQLSEITGINQAAISRIENGRSGLDIGHLILIARALKCKPADLFKRLTTKF
jgi:transcriptional regulator with XRE-family HTH domain